MPECAKNRTNAERMSMDTVCRILGGTLFPDSGNFLPRKR